MHEGRWPEAQAGLEEAMRTFTAEPERSSSAAMAFWALGDVYKGEGKLTRALETEKHALVEYRHLYPEPHTSWAAPLASMATILLKQGKYAAAEENARQAYRIRRDRLSPSDLKTLEAEFFLGRALTGLHRYAEAESLLLEASRLSRRPAASRPPGLRSAAADAVHGLQLRSRSLVQ